MAAPSPPERSVPGAALQPVRALVLPEPTEQDELSDDAFGDLDSDLDAPVAGLSSLADDPEDWLAPLDAPADEEVDVWLSAAGAFLEDG